MTNRRLLITSLAAAALVSLATPAHAVPTWSQIRATTDWTVQSTKEHDVAGTVTVRRAVIDGVQCWQGQAHVDVAAATLLQVAMDIEGTTDWASTANVAEAKVLSSGGGTMEYYQLMDVPGWTMSKDRFWFLRGRQFTEGSTTVFSWEKLDAGGSHADVYQQFVADHPKAIEPPVNAGAWAFTPAGDGTTDVEYTICTDAGGAIPEKVQALATSSTLPDTVGDLVREARKRSR